MTDNGNHAARPTGDGLIDFLDFAITKGYIKVATGQALKTACKEVLTATEGEGWGSTDLTKMDIEDTLRRFETLRAMKFSVGSLSTYKSRFTRSVQMFESFRTNPAAWKPDVKQRSRSSRTTPTETLSPQTPGPSKETTSAPVERILTTSHTSNVITYPFPLREGVLVSIQLPADVTHREAKRLASFIDSLAIDEQPALPAASTS